MAVRTSRSNSMEVEDWKLDPGHVDCVIFITILSQTLCSPTEKEKETPSHVVRRSLSIIYTLAFREFSVPRLLQHLALTLFTVSDIPKRKSSENNGQELKSGISFSFSTSLSVLTLCHITSHLPINTFPPLSAFAFFSTHSL